MDHQKRNIQEGKWEEYPDASSSPFFWAWANNYFKTLPLKLVTTPASNCHPVNYGQGTTPGTPFVAFDDSVALSAQNGDRFIAVLDSLNPRRGFVGETVEEKEMYGSVVGAICYFDDKGRLQSISPFSQVLFPAVRDNRESVPKWDSVFLCGQTLAFLSYRSCGRGQLQLKGFRMNHEERIVSSFKHVTFLFQGFSDYDALCGGNRAEEKCQVFGRWLCVHSKGANQYFCLDMKSIQTGRSTREKEQYWDDNGHDDDMAERVTTAYDLVAFSDSLDPATVLESVKDVPSYYEPTNFNGYPAKCVKCSRKTVRGTITLGTTVAGLGSGLCPNCKIRYSKGKKSWLCWNGIGSGESGDIRECFGTLHAPDYICHRSHVDPSMIKIEHCPNSCRNDCQQGDIRVSHEIRLSLDHTIPNNSAL